MLGHLRKVEAGQHARGLAGQGGAVGRHAEEDLPPAVHAGLRAVGVVIRDHVEDLHATLVRFPVPVRHRLRTPELIAGRKKLVPVVERPAVELGVGELDVVRPEVQRQIQDFFRAVDVLPVQHGVEDHRIALRLDRARHLDLVGEGVGPREMVVEGRVARLEADLDVVEPRFPETPHPGRVHADGRGDEVGVVAEAARLRHQRFEVAAHERFAAGEAELRRPELPGFTQGADPLLRGQLAPGPGEIERVRAVRALQRAGVGQLREQPEGAGGSVGHGGILSDDGRPRCKVTAER